MSSLLSLLTFPKLELYVLIAVASILAFHVVPYIIDPRRLRTYPGPTVARFSAIWMAWATYFDHGQTNVYDSHKKYGPFVRIAPNHISISDPEALDLVYGHGGHTLKSDFYDAFVQFRGTSNVFNTRSRVDHARKRKAIAHSLSQKSVVEFEPIIHEYQRLLVQHWDEICAAAVKGVPGTRGSCTWRASNGRAWFNCLPWFNYLAFDIIGDLAFGSPFGMLAAVEDIAHVAKSQEAAMRSFNMTEDTDTDQKSAFKFEVEKIQAIEALNLRADLSTFIGVLPVWCRPIMMRLLSFGKGRLAANGLGSMAVTAIAKRLRTPTGRTDFISKLLEAKDGQGMPLSTKELSAEAFSLMVGGSDTTSNSICAITYYLARNRDVQAKLQHELDEALGSPETFAKEDDIRIPQYGQLNKLPYLRAVIDEAMRLHTLVGFGLPRVVSEPGLTVLGKSFAPGTVLSVPLMVIHMDKSIWGDDADTFNPERWFKGDKERMQKAFLPFSFGPRACIGRNLASLELLVSIAMLIHRYDIILEAPDEPLKVHEGFIRKPVDCAVGVKRRF